MSEMRDSRCRLCGDRAAFRFSLRVLKRYDVAYFLCPSCESLQTEEPFWVEEAYADKRLIYDVGRVQRTQIVAAAFALILEKAGLREQGPMLDWGGGEGMLCRMLRDRGFGFHCYDLYEPPPAYALAYQTLNPSELRPLVLTAVEVLEHLPQPTVELEQMFASEPKLLLFTTELYDGHGADWSYLAPMTGRHVFFYSARAMQWIAKRFKYSYVRLPGLHVFTREPERLAELTAPAEAFSVRAAQAWARHLTSPDL